MSLLSNTQGRPERVRSLVGLLSAHGGTMPREEVYDWLLPPFFRNRDQVPTSIQNTIGAASDLGLVETFRDRLVLVHPHVPMSEDALSDYCHDFLCTTEKQEDRVLLDAFAYFVVRSEQHGSTDWIESNRQVADEVNDVLMKQASEDDERRFNDTKIAPWKSWMTYLGLGWEAPSLPTFYPSVTERLQRVVRDVGMVLGSDREVDAATFMREVASRMPYLDGGDRFRSICDSVPFRPTGTTWILSEALRDLHDDGTLRLHVRGDAREGQQLAPDDTHSIRSYFVSVTILRGIA